ncbi:hypothetical protein BEP19_03460 [Ammoniphilus oxalaticus]|uniref:DUF4179 domain-containing protein n=1 Tax=Ammoniphilus oxalaticus TaxID=66863 RepID=A0A419SNX6_9BACL|nr:DUF4179 domain-containing protein [Ammoniphilus oxalaticus]RKD25996.1 hypothetical protein BEP19_03460 [Ammoniphilus oxalaticus]
MDKEIVNKISEELDPTDKQKKRMFNQILVNRQNKQTKPSPTRLKPKLVAALIACCLITTTAIAATFIGLDTKFLNFLNPSSEQQIKHLANGASTVEKKIKNKNGTLHINQVIGDSNLVYILMDFTAPEGTVLDKARYRFEDSDIRSIQGFQGIGFTKLDDKHAEDNQISMMMRLKTRESLMGQKIKLKLSDLQAADPFPGIFKTVIPGEWKTSFTLDFKDYSTVYDLDKPITLFDHAATLKSVSISPISVTIIVETPFVEEISKAHGWMEEVGLDEYLDNLPITINYTDGSSETTTIFNGMYVADTLKEELFIMKTFENVINDKEIESIVFFDTVIPVDQ